jgi:hypothetical protein
VLRAPRFPLQALADAEYLNGGREASRIDLFDGGGKQQVGTRCRGELTIGFLVARVAVEIAALVELGGVDEQQCSRAWRISERCPS